MIAVRARHHRWTAPEVVQTSAMDCGPAALKCILEGFGISVSYGRLREACQTGLDGTSIDTIEAVANQLGVEAEQVMLPPDQLFLPKGIQLPALMVVHLPAGPAHFIVVWRRVGAWLQVMDPATGRRWVKAQDFASELFNHELSVPAADWRNWAGTDEYAAPLISRMARLGVSRSDAQAFVAKALRDDNWFTAAVLDAAVRFAVALHASGAVKAGRPSAEMIRTLFEATCASTEDIYALIPRDYWTTHPDPRSRELGERRVLLRGAVLLLVRGRSSAATSGEHAPDMLTPELASALTDRRDRPLREIWRFLREGGVTAPWLLAAATLVAVFVSLFEALLMRGMIEIGQSLNPGLERIAGAAAIIAFMAIMLCFRLPLAAESMRLGRQLETRLRMAILAKLPELPDRYLQSRPISDMADRAHSLQMVRLIPGLVLHVLQLAAEIGLTVAGLFLLDAAVGLWAMLLAAAAILVPALCRRSVQEVDMRARSHSAALNSVVLDALLGHVPIRVHAAQAAVKGVHEALLADWSRAMRHLLGVSASAAALQQLVCQGLCAAILLNHFAESAAIHGSDLLLVYWLLKIPAAGQSLVGLALQFPGQRNVVTRLVEPLAAPAPRDPPAAPPRGSRAPIRLLRRAAHVMLEEASVVASGHSVLSGITLTVEAGEHVAFVGPSGAGKSSLLGLLLGFHQLAGGRLLVDGRPLTAERLESLRRETAWVDPAVQLWNRSLLDNLTYANVTPGYESVLSSLDAADLRPVLKRMPQGLRTELGEGGALVSGGEGQRVRFARALAQDGVRLAILDEPFRGLARSQRQSLMDEARAHWRGATLLCVTHDIAETRGFDRVVVIENGTIAESGAPERLARGGTRYASLLAAEAKAQASLWAGDWNRIRLEDGNVIRVG